MPVLSPQDQTQDPLSPSGNAPAQAAEDKASAHQSRRARKKELEKLKEETRSKYARPKKLGLKRIAKEVREDNLSSDAIRESLVKRQSQKSVGYAVSQSVKKNIANLCLVIIACILIIIFLLSALQEDAGNFTIRVDRRDMSKYGLILSSSADFSQGDSQLAVNPLANATNIAQDSIPSNLVDFDGDNNGENYIAYTFYVRNTGKETIDYRWAVNVQSVTRNIDSAVRVAITYNNNAKVVYAKPAADGAAEPGTVTFVADKTVQATQVRGLEVGSSDRYTVIVWLEGNDPQCVDDLIGGTIQLEMDIEAIPRDPA